MPVKLSWIAIFLCCTAVFAWSLNRDIHAEKQYAGDLRNRVVGARLQKDGVSPYFYKWKKGDGLRYYDPNNFDSVRVANITASPFLHCLLYPVADLPQRTISLYWLLAEYLAFLLIVALGCLLAKTTTRKWLVLVTACLFLLTEGWQMHVANGQNYIYVPLLALVFFYLLRNRRSLLLAFVAGSIATSLVLIKPNALVFFIPFLLLLHGYNKNYLLVLFLPVLLAIALIFCNKQQVFLWQQYRENIAQQIKIHSNEMPERLLNDADPAFPVWEGISKKEIAAEARLHPLHIHSENGNFFVAARIFFKQQISSRTLGILSGVSMFLLLLVFYRRRPTGGYGIYAVAFTGYSLYMLVDLFSPVYRHQYYTVQWMFPLILCAAIYQRGLVPVYLLMAAGLVLNILNIPIMPMEHTLGEYSMLVGVIAMALRRENATVQ